MAEQPLAPSSLFSHVQDADYFHVPRVMTSPEDDGHIYLPQPLAREKAGPAGHGGGHHRQYEPVVQVKSGVELIDSNLRPLDLVLTKFMVLEVVAAILCVFLFAGLAAHLGRGRPPRGRLWNMLEMMLVFLRDEVARPAIGKHDADRFLPFLWTMFFFVLFCNLLGMLPWAGSPTGALATTGALAIITFGTVVGSGMAKLGAVGFWKAQVPHMDLPGVLAVGLIPMIFLIEVLGLAIKHFVLSVRLLANMMAGHIVLAVLIAFIAVTAESIAWYGVMPASVLGATALSLLELFVAFLQAYIFTFLSALFIGMAVHPH